MPVVALFLFCHVEVIFDEDEHGHDAELGEGCGVHAACGGEGDVCLGEPCAFRPLADAGAGGLYPSEVGGEFFDAAGVPGVEVSEDDLCVGEVVEPSLFLFGGAVDGGAVLVVGVAELA